MREAGKHCTSVSMGCGNTAPDGPESLVFLARLSFVDVDNSLAEVVLSSGAIVDAFQSEDGLVGILLNLGPPEA